MGRVRPAVLAVLVIGAALLSSATVARAHGDPASDELLARDVFLPIDAKVEPDVTARLSQVVGSARKAGFRIKVALIGTRYDLGTAFSLYNEAQKYAEFLGRELSLQYRDRLLVVMPDGFGYSIDGRADERGMRLVKALPVPGRNATQQVKAATGAVRRLAAASGYVLPLPEQSTGVSETRDRMTIAAGATALLALLAAIVFFRRGRTAARE